VLLMPAARLSLPPPSETLSPGSIYTAVLTADGTVGLYQTVELPLRKLSAPA